MSRLIIRHSRGDGGEARFAVLRHENDAGEGDGESVQQECVTVPSPDAFMVPNRPPGQALTHQLRWYLEEFLQYPFSPQIEIARDVEAALEAWGRQAFEALFGGGDARDWMIQARDERDFRVRIACDEPSILAWPWEALLDPDRGVLGSRFVATDIQATVGSLARIFQRHRFTIVWDNFESVRGVPDTEVAPLLSEEDQNSLRHFLEALNGGPTKVLITSRGKEEWLGAENCYQMVVSGLANDELYDYAAQVLEDLGLQQRRDDPELPELLKWLDGHPLGMHAALLQLKDRSARQVREALERNFHRTAKNLDLPSRRLIGTLQFAIQVVPAELQRLLIPLGLHERFIEADLLNRIAYRVDAQCTPERLERFLNGLVPAGVLTELGDGIYELHPVLSSYLRSAWLPLCAPEEVTVWTRAFVELTAHHATILSLGLMNGQKRANALDAFYCLEANFYFATKEAERLGQQSAFNDLTSARAQYALQLRRLREAELLYLRLAQDCQIREDYHNLARVNHQLGIVAATRHDLAAAERWYRASLEIAEKLNDQHGAAITYLELGSVAQELRDFTAAESWCKKALPIFKALGDELHETGTYHQLGIIAGARRDFDAAEHWYRRSLKIKEKLGDDHGAALTYHQLGLVAEELRDFAAAESLYQEALAIFERLGDWLHAALSGHQLGTVAVERRDFAAAKAWYIRSLKINERMGNQHDAALSYHQLGNVAVEQRDFVVAEIWYEKALAIAERLNDQHGAALTLGQLGILNNLQKRKLEAGRCFIRATKIFARHQDNENAKRSAAHFLAIYDQSSSEDRRQLRLLWEEAGLPSIEGSM